MESPTTRSGATIRLLLVLLAVPFVAFVVARGIEWKLDSSLRDALVTQFPGNSANWSGASVSALCSQPGVRSDSELSETCSLSDNIGLLKTGAIVAAILGVGMLIVIKTAGKLSTGNRTLLLLLFAPGLHLTMTAVCVLVVLQAVLGMAAIYYGESALIGRIHIGIMIGLGIGAGFGVLAVIRAQFSTIRKATTIVLGKKLASENHPQLWRFVDELAGTMGADAPEAIVAGLEPNFYVTEANVICLDGKLTGRTMFLSLPMCRILSLDELKAVLGHELAHYKGLDTRFSRRFYPIYRGAAQGIVNIASGFSEKGGAGQLALLPAFVILSYFLDSFSESEKAISRERELVADREAAKIATGRNLATALVKFHAFSDAWPAIRQEMKRVLEEGNQITNVSAFFTEVSRRRASDEVVKAVSEQGPVHPTNTHPPLSQRLKNLNLTLEELSHDAASLSPLNPAISVVTKLEDLERELTDVEHAMMIRRGEAQIASTG